MHASIRCLIAFTKHTMFYAKADNLSWRAHLTCSGLLMPFTGRATPASTLNRPLIHLSVLPHLLTWL